MKKKVKAFILGNFMLKIIGILLAILLWLMLNNAQDPLVSRTVVVPIQYDESVLEERKLVAIYKPATVTIPVMVRKSRIRTLSPDDFTVTADMTDVIGEVMDAPDTTMILLEITKSSAATYIEEWQYPQSQNYVKVILDKLKTAKYAVGFNTTKEPPEGYQLGELFCIPTKVTVSGPTSAFSNLAAVKATVDLSQITETTTSLEAPLGLYDGNNRLLTNTGLTLSQDTVEVTVGLSQSKEISISIASYSGIPAEGYQVSNIDYYPKLITICGSKNALANISTISIPRSELDITGADGTRDFIIDIRPYLSDDVTLAEETGSEVHVTIELEQLETRKFSISTDHFTFKNTNDSYKYEILSSDASISLSAFKEDLDIFESMKEEIAGSIDVGGMPPGDYISIPVALELDHAYRLQDEVTVSIRISEDEPSETETEETPSESESDRTPATEESESASAQDPESESAESSAEESVTETGSVSEEE